MAAVAMTTAAAVKAVGAIENWELTAYDAGGTAPHGWAYDPPSYEDVLRFIKEATVVAVDRQLGEGSRKKRLGNKDWLIYAVRDLLDVFYTKLWTIAKTDRAHRGVAEQNEIFRLNHHLKRVVDMLRNDKLDFLSRDGWDLRTWKSEQRQRTEYAAAKASLPKELRNDPNQLEWVLEEKRMRKEDAKQERYYAKLQKERIAKGGKVTAEGLAEIEERRVARAAELEKKIAKARKWKLATPAERQAEYEAKARAAKKEAK